MTAEKPADLFRTLGTDLSAWGGKEIAVRAPATGEALASLAGDSAKTIGNKIAAAASAQKIFSTLPRRERVKLLEAAATAIKEHRETIAAVLSLESGKTMKEALVEADGSVNVLLNTIKDATLADFGNMARTKERPPVGNVGLITSFNFPMAVAYWTLAPAWLAANAVIWKPSEKTPLTALACKSVFDKAAGAHKDLLQIVIGGRDAGQALVAHEGVGMVSATGSVGMGKAIEKTLAKKSGNIAPPILELGGNNGVIISDKSSPEHLQFAVNAVMGSFLGSTGQRCTNTRRLIVHKSVYDQVAGLFETAIKDFLGQAVKKSAMDTENTYGYNALIDEDAFKRFEHAKKQAAEEGGKIVLGNRLKIPGGFYVEPALALLPEQTNIMFEETFAPILFIAPYEKFDDALSMLNAPGNAGLVGAIYTQSQSEADQFASVCEAGHCLINPPKGTGTPAHGMGFGGNKDSGCGEILNAADPLAAFTRRDTFTRIAWNKDITMR